MEGRGGSSQVEVVVDACFAINFLAIDRTDLLAELEPYRFHVPSEVEREIEREVQRRRLQRAFREGTLNRLEITDQEEIARSVELRSVFGAGESMAVAVAESRGWVVATDEKRKLRHLILDALGEDFLLNTEGVLVEAINQGLLTVPQGEGVRGELSNNGYLIKATIAQLRRRRRGRYVP